MGPGILADIQTLQERFEFLVLSLPCWRPDPTLIKAHIGGRRLLNAMD